ncbi:HNH homing endonuclease [Serratia phage vB_SmaP-UFV01]|uniref:HNH homing endonuclease n=1 Tax=Serratia phage vB_SmaP-UFV01 TaxID=2749302 RepID=A0AAE7KC07_9CAUD|nr:HNH homing endonuclease [Serratia phage vB_SmaP-UFV01]
MPYSELYIYDESAEFLLVHAKDRHKVKAGTPVRASKSHNGYRLIKVQGKTRRLHRVIWELHNGPIPDGLEVDHIDRDKENNRIGNLRLVTKSQNAFNRANHSGKVLPKGIVFLPKGNTYQARIMVSGKRYVYHNQDLEKALQWLTAKREELHGEHRCN